MKILCLIIALFSTLLWINLMFVDLINAKVNPYQKSGEESEIDRKRGILRTIAIVIMSIFWPIALSI